jgi:hypothetical protein
MQIDFNRIEMNQDLFLHYFFPLLKKKERKLLVSDENKLSLQRQKYYKLKSDVTMGKRTQAEEIVLTGIMINGIRMNQEVLSQRKIDITFANVLQNNVDACTALNIEQEVLKARLKEKTSEFDAAFTAMLKKASEARKIIKIDFPQPLWKEFGIEDKR